MNILIADDDIKSCNIIIKYLIRYGKCHYTVNGLETVETFRRAIEQNKPYSLICMDIIMPIMDGYKAFKEIRNIEKQYNIPNEKAVKIIITSELSDGRNLKKAFDLGCIAYAGKPINEKELIQVIETIVINDKFHNLS